jgi:hypothetical protein
MNYEYRMVQVPRDLAVKMGKAEGVAARYMQETIDANTGNGWEYYRMDNLTITENPGCLAALFGQKEVYHSVGVLCFRRAKNNG